MHGSIEGEADAINGIEDGKIQLDSFRENTIELFGRQVLFSRAK
jgi:hypothetical protein